MQTAKLVGAKPGNRPVVLPVRQRAQVVRQVLEERLETLLPVAMREAGFDLWLILCQEDNLDPVFTTMIPMDAWCPILQMLIFYDRGPERGVERINLSMTDTGTLYDRPWKGRHQEEQWSILRDIICERDPRRIGVNIGSTQWAAGGLTHNLYTKLVAALPPAYHSRLASAEPLATIWLSTLADTELLLFEHVVNVAHDLLARCLSRQAIIPGVTTVQDLEWTYWQQSADLGLELAFKPFFNLVRREQMKARFGQDDAVIRPGDLIHSDVGIRYLRLNSDHQECAYVLQSGESDAPQGLKRLMGAANHLQDIYMAEFRAGLSGNELLSRILTRARRDGIPNPKVYSHSLGLFLHEPGPLIGLPWEQERNVGRGDVTLRASSCFTMELSVTDRVPEWADQQVTMSLEQDVAYTAEGCRVVDGRQTELYLI